jgi:poly(hydroxyalkanoate) depolymerase family esterase
MRHVRMVTLLTAGAMSACTGSVPQVASLSSGLTEDTNFGSNPGMLKMYTYSPASMPSGAAPLVVALHGCTQTAADYVNAGWNELADVAKFYVVYAEQQSSNNAEECFDWFTTSDITRDAGEALSIKQMVDAMKAMVSIDPARVFVTGLSSGGAMTPVMLATYPDVFAAGASMSGIPYGCAMSETDAFSCENPGVTKTASAWGDLVRGADSGFAGPFPRLSIWQGSSDSTVAPANQTAMVAQWTNVHGLPQTATATNSVGPATHAVYADAQGNVAVETYLIPNMGHGTALEVGFAPAGGCGQAGAFLLDVGICSTYWAGAFFGLIAPAATGDGGDGDDLAGVSGDFGSAGSGGSGGGGNGGSGGGGGSGSGKSHGCSYVAGARDDASATMTLLLALSAAALVSARRRRSVAR